MNKFDLCIHWMLASWVSFASLCLMGCTESGESHHEAEHVLPNHWPKDLKAAADGLRSRMQSLIQTSDDQQQNKTRDELFDIVSWIPEVAADTDLKEADWVPIYELTEQIERTSANRQIFDVDRIESLAKLCEEAMEKLASQTPGK